MIDSFVPQPYPLECSVDGETWMLVLGWQITAGRLVSVLAAPAGGAVPYPDDTLQYRLAELPGRRVVQAFTSPSPRPVAAPARSTTSSA